MRHDLAAPGFFDRATGIHRQDCALMAADSPDIAAQAEAARADLDALEELAGDERAVAYGIAARQAYDLMRRLIGQLSGLLILSMAGGRRAIRDLPDMAAARERLDEAGAVLGAASVPARLARHHAALEAAHAAVAAALAGVGRSDGRPECEGTATASRALAEAYGLLQAAADPRIGMTMVDFRHACCTCGAGLRHQTQDQ